MVSVIIVSWNSRDVIGRCLSSLRRSHPVDRRSHPVDREVGYKPLEIILVDNASHDGTVEYVEKNFPEIVLIKNSENIGFSCANNQRIRIAKGEFILFLNADAYITPDFLEILVKEMEKDEKIGMAGGKVYKDRGKKILDSTGIFFPFFKMGPYDRGEGEEDRGQYDREEFTSGISCACALYRRKCLEDIRLGDEYFDEKYFAYYEDVDLAWRARIQGWKCLYEPRAIAYHKRRGKAIKDTPLFSRAMANLYLTYLKNESGIGLIFLFLFKIPHEIGRLLFRIVFGGKASYSPRVLESLKLGKKDLQEALRRRRVIQGFSNDR